MTNRCFHNVFVVDNFDLVCKGMGGDRMVFVCYNY